MTERSPDLSTLRSPLYGTMDRIPGGTMVIPLVLGAIVGTLLEAATFVPLFPMVFGAKEALAQATPHVSFSMMPTVWLAVAGVFFCGGFKGARSAGNTPPLMALRESEPKLRGMT